MRLFVSGESFLERTEQILGLAPGAPQARRRPTRRAFRRPQHGVLAHRHAVAFAVSKQGLADAPEMASVLVTGRGRCARNRREDVLILAHGPGDDAENPRWLNQLEARAEAVRPRPSGRAGGDPARRLAGEAQGLGADPQFVEHAAKNGRAIVIPFRVEGFGPYAEVLKGLDYASDGRGLVPDAGVTQWIEHQITTLADAEFRTTAD